MYPLFLESPQKLRYFLAIIVQILAIKTGKAEHRDNGHEKHLRDTGSSRYICKIEFN